MKHISAHSHSQHHQVSFAQGASEIIEHKGNSLAVWTENTPLLRDQQIATIGSCHFEDEDSSVELLNYTCEYLRGKCKCVVGPMNGSTWLEHRLVTYSNGSPPFLLEPQSPAHWNRIFSQCGFVELAEYSSSILDLTLTNQPSDKLARRLYSRGVSIRALDLEHFERDLRLIYELSCESFVDNFLYTELPEESFLQKYENAKSHLDPDLILIAERNSKIVGFVFCYPDLQLPDTLVVKTLASASEAGIAGIGNHLVSSVQEIARKKGYQKAIHALQHHSNTSLKITKRNDAKVFRKYALLIKDLTS